MRAPRSALGVCALGAVAGLLVLSSVHVARPEAAADRAATTVEPARWAPPDVASVALLRHAAITQSRQAGSALARCERTSRASFLHCALPPLAQLGMSGKMNSTILLRIAEGARPPQRCNARIRALAGTEAVVAMLATSTLRAELGGSAERSGGAIRAMARHARQLARAPGWNAACYPTPSPAA
jgi:hypothetical protein